MLWGYVGIFPTIIAILNSVIAVGVSHFKPEQTRAKAALLVSAIILGLAAAGATIAEQQHTSADQAERVALIASIREELGEHIRRGNLVLATLADMNNQTAIGEANAWAAAAEEYLRSSLGESYVIRFEDGSGLMYATPIGFSPERTPTYVAVSHRIERLQQFSAELSPARTS